MKTTCFGKYRTVCFLYETILEKHIFVDDKSAGTW